MGAEWNGKWIKSENVGNYKWDGYGTTEWSKFWYGDETGIPEGLASNGEDIPNFDGMESMLNHIARKCADEKILYKDSCDIVFRMDFELCRLIIAEATVLLNNMFAVETLEEMQKSELWFGEYEPYTVENYTSELCYLINRVKMVKKLLKQYKEYELIVEVSW